MIDCCCSCVSFSLVESTTANADRVEKIGDCRLLVGRNEGAAAKGCSTVSLRVSFAAGDVKEKRDLSSSSSSCRLPMMSERFPGALSANPDKLGKRSEAVDALSLVVFVSLLIMD